VLAIALLAGALWPHLHPVPAVRGVDGRIGGLADTVLGLAAGLILGLVLWQGFGQTRKTGNLWGPALAGVFLGYQAAVVLTLAAAALHAPFALIQRRRAPPTPHRPATAPTSPRPPFSLAFWLAPLSLAWVLFWNAIVQHWPIVG
jgi:hypothetical protein